MSRLCEIGLALGGGGARGLAHLGVLCALEKERIPIDLICGTSMGSLVASVYATSLKCESTIERFRRYLNSKEFKKTNLDFLYQPPRGNIDPKNDGIFHRFASFIKKSFFYSQSLTKRSPISEEDFTQHVNTLLDDIEIQQTQIPLSIIALDLKTGKEIVLRQGSIRKAARASCAIPGILPPVKIGDWELVDGGWIDRVPVNPAKEMGADLVVAVDVTEKLDDSEDFNTGLGIFLRAYEITYSALTERQVKDADIIIRPDVSGIHWAEFDRLDQCLKIGEEAALKKIDEIRSAIRKKKIRKCFSPFGRSVSPK
jgi:NTE family protein